MWPKHDKNIPKPGTQTDSKWDKSRKTQENSPEKACSENKNKKNKIVAPSAPVTDSFEHHRPLLAPSMGCCCYCDCHGGRHKFLKDFRR